MHALRILRRNPGFTFVAVLTLGAAIGANTAIFSVADAVLLHPLPYQHPEQLVLVTKNMPMFELRKSDASALDFLDYRAESKSFSQMAALQLNSVNLTSGGPEAVRVFGLSVSPSLFPMLGVRPIAGRVFAADDDRVVILGADLWKSRFAGDPAIVGTQITINAEHFTVVGIVPPVLQFIELSQIYVPLRLNAAQLAPNMRGRQNIDVVARLRPDTTLEQARAEMKLVAGRMTRRLPDWYPSGWSIDLDPLADSVAGDLRTPLIILLAAVGMVLLIARANVANLLLARATGRQREISIRASLGARRWDIARQLFMESFVLAILSGAAGILIGAWTLELFTRLGPENLLRGQRPGIDAWVAVFTFALALSTSVFFGLAPAISASRMDLRAGMVRPGTRLRAVLIVAEVALSLVLLVGAGLLIRSFQRLHTVNLGFQTAGLLTARVTLPVATYREPTRIAAFQAEFLRRVEALPGVASAALVNGLPFWRGRRWRLSPNRGPSLGRRPSRARCREAQCQRALFRNHGNSAQTRPSFHRAGWAERTQGRGDR